MLGPAETKLRRQRIESVADRLDELASNARDGLVQYPEFVSLLGALHALGFFPLAEQVSAVAQALVS
jgi:hypothetical protein